MTTSDFTHTEYERALLSNGFERCRCISSHHLHSALNDGTLAHFNEAAAEDDCNTLREQLAYLIDARDYENSQLDEQA